MSTTVIFSNMGDIDTKVLTNLWNNMTDVNVVEITRKTKNALLKVNEAIEKETDTLIMCGHGCGEGLFNPSFDKSAYLISRSNKNLIKAKRVISIWCHAKDFAERYGVKGFYSSMFISNPMEAKMNGILDSTYEKITEEEVLFCNRVNKLMNDNVPMRAWICLLKKDADYNDPVVRFNYNGLRYYKTGIVIEKRNDFHRVFDFEYSNLLPVKF